MSCRLYSVSAVQGWFERAFLCSQQSQFEPSNESWWADCLRAERTDGVSCYFMSVHCIMTGQIPADTIVYRQPTHLTALTSTTWRTPKGHMGMVLTWFKGTSQTTRWLEDGISLTVRGPSTMTTTWSKNKTASWETVVWLFQLDSWFTRCGSPCQQSQDAVRRTPTTVSARALIDIKHGKY